MPYIQLVTFAGISLTLADMPVSDISAVFGAGQKGPRLIAWEAAVFVC